MSKTCVVAWFQHYQSDRFGYPAEIIHDGPALNFGDFRGNRTLQVGRNA